MASMAQLPEYVETIPKRAMNGMRTSNRLYILPFLWVCRIGASVIIAAYCLGTIMGYMHPPLLIFLAALFGSGIVLVGSEIGLIDYLKSITPISLYDDRMRILRSWTGIYSLQSNDIPYGHMAQINVVRGSSNQRVDEINGWVLHRDAPTILAIDLVGGGRIKTGDKDPNEILKIVGLLRAKGVNVIDVGQGPGTIEKL